MSKNVGLPILLLLAMFLVSCGSTGSAQVDEEEFVTVENGEFMLRGEPYRYVGTNFWYAPILASAGEYGDRARLAAELDSLCALGVDNLRVLVGGDGSRPVRGHIEPNLQTAPGEYNVELLEGLDYLLVELEKRDMRAVIYLNNAWEWSGGFGTYLEWTGYGEAPDPATNYSDYKTFVSKFMIDSVARGMYRNHVRAIVGRTNSITGKPYAESPAIMSWQIANEPRCFAKDNKAIFEEWLIEIGRLIKSVDNRHLVSTGSEGKWGCEGDIELWARVHNSDAIDYANIHIWPYNWKWISADSIAEKLPLVFENTASYIAEHRALTTKPIVLEEFGFPRDDMRVALGTPTTLRDDYYRYVFGMMQDDGSLNGVNFWGWGGLAQPTHENWQPGDDYTGDPAQEAQGLNSVFIGDKTTLDIIRSANAALKRQQR